MGLILRSKNTGLFLMFHTERIGNWTDKEEVVIDGWTDDVNKAGNLCGVYLRVGNNDLSKIRTNPDSEVLEAEFKTVTTVTLLEKQNGETC